MTSHFNNISEVLAPASVISFGYWGQKPSKRDYSDIILNSQSSLANYKKWAWDLLPVLTLVPQVGTVITLFLEASRATQIADKIFESRDLKTASYHTFRGLPVLGNLLLTLFEQPLSTSPLGRRFILVLKLLTISHQIYIAAHRIYTQKTTESQFEKLCMHIVSNIFCLAALIFNNRLTTIAFLGMQGMAGFYHTVRLADKDKTFSAYIHLGLSLARLTQALYILYQCLFPKIEKPKPHISFEELFEARRQLLIAPSETRKTEFSKYERVVKDILGEEYLYFKRTGPEEKFLILCADADHNNSLNPGYIQSIIQTLSKKYDVKFRTIYKVEDIQKEIRFASQIGRVIGLLLSGHGEPLSIRLSNDSSTGRLHSRDVTPLLFEGLDPNCIIALDSCSTAGYPHFSIAYRVANLSQRTTFAADRPFTDLSLKQVSPLEWSFEHSSKTVDTKKLIPLENDSFLTFLKSLFRQH